MTRDEVQHWLESTLDVSRGTFAQLETYVAMLIAANETQNLISKSSVVDIWDRHILDSAQIALHLTDRPGPILDLGSGPGLPGIVLAIITDTPVALVESRKKRCAFLDMAISELRLEGRATVYCADLQRVEPFLAGVITARAFAPIQTLLDLARPFSTPTTRWVLPRGQKAGMDYATLPRKHKAMFHVEQSLTDDSAGILIGDGAA